MNNSACVNSKPRSAASRPWSPNWRYRPPHAPGGVEKKAMTAARRRMIVTDIREHFDVSRRHTSRALDLPRSSLRYTPGAPQDERRWTAQIEELAGTHPRFGYRRIRALLDREGYVGVDNQAVRRIWRLSGLRLAGPRATPKPRRPHGQDANACQRALKNKLPVSVLQYPYLSRWLITGMYVFMSHQNELPDLHRCECPTCPAAPWTARPLRCTVPSTGSLLPPTSAAVTPSGIPRPATRAWRHRPGGPHHRLQLPYRPSRTTRVATGHRDSPGAGSAALEPGQAG